MARIDLNHIRHAYGPNPKSDKDYALKEVHHSWEDAAMVKLSRAADARIAAADARSKASMQKLEQINQQYLAKAATDIAVPGDNTSPAGVYPQTPAPSRSVIYNTPVTVPTKVFKNYR